jgi:hypothetical protein
MNNIFMTCTQSVCTICGEQYYSHSAGEIICDHCDSTIEEISALRKILIRSWIKNGEMESKLQELQAMVDEAENSPL